jgi:hypothetical protein
MMLPLKYLLSVKLDNVLLVVDNAKSPMNPVSFRNKRSSTGGHSHSNAALKNRWSSMPPCVDDNNATNLKDSMDGMLSAPVHMENETGGNGVTRVRIPNRQRSHNLIHQERRSFSSPIIRKREKVQRSRSLQVPVRQVSPVVTQRKRLDSPAEAEMAANTSTTKKMTKADGARSRTLRIPIRRSSRRSIHMGSPEQSFNLMSISKDFAKIDKLIAAGLIDIALKEIEANY